MAVLIRREMVLSESVPVFVQMPRRRVSSSVAPWWLLAARRVHSGFNTCHRPTPQLGEFFNVYHRRADVGPRSRADESLTPATGTRVVRPLLTHFAK